MPKESDAGLRSRKGCWTCRERHKKCDEQRPQCRRCTTSGRTCAGYGIRLAWTIDASVDGADSGTGPTDNVARSGGVGSRRLNRTPARRHRAAHALAMNHGTSGVTTEGAGSHDGNTTPPTAIPSVPWSSADEALFESFKTSGIYTLLGRGNVPSTLIGELLSLCSSSVTLRHACLAYHANNISNDHHADASNYLDTALARYQDDLRDPDMINANSTLLTGILLCSIGISTLTPWTFHLAGLEAVLRHRALIDPHQRTPFTEHMVEVVGLLDFPTVTIGAIDSKHQIWSRFVAPHSQTGIEPTSGLPRTLLDLLSSVDRPRTSFETTLLLWPSERGDSYAQHHLWEAWRCAGILNHRSLHRPRADYSDTDAILMKMFASIEALSNTLDCPFQQPLKDSIVYPLFISSLHTREASVDRTFVDKYWQGLVRDGRFSGALKAFSILQQVWSCFNDEEISTYEALRLADNFARQKNLEIHLY